MTHLFWGIIKTADSQNNNDEFWISLLAGWVPLEISPWRALPPLRAHIRRADNWPP